MYPIRPSVLLRNISENARVIKISKDCITHNTYFISLRSDYDVPGKYISEWLSALDISPNLNAALWRRQAGAGCWFLDDGGVTRVERHAKYCAMYMALVRTYLSLS